MTKSTYRGRFAPSPTGDLHIGSLIAAVGSYLAARSAQGEWWVRIEDIDPPRETPGAAARILRTLEAYGFEWDWHGYQHDRFSVYQERLAQLRAQQRIYPCSCSRKTRQESDQQRYPGTCRNEQLTLASLTAWRINTERTVIRFTDGLQGPLHYDFDQVVGDFVIQRADGYVAYQLAVAVDDADQGMTDVVRGVDLLDSTPRQILIQQQLGLTPPRYCHLPVVVNHLGQKLSKQTHAAPLDMKNPVPSLWMALRYLGQSPPAELYRADLATLWAWAHSHWNWQTVPTNRQIQVEELAILADKA